MMAPSTPPARSMSFVSRYRPPAPLLLALALLVPGPQPAEAATGGPDSFGYTWADSDEPGVTRTIPGFAGTTLLQPLGFVGDEGVARVSLPRPFPFYGGSFNAFTISTNGWISLANPGNPEPLAQNVPNAQNPNNLIAFLWDNWAADLDIASAYSGETFAGDGYGTYVKLAPVGAPASYLEIYIVLFYNGVIKIVYPSQDPLAITGAATVVGIENANGTVGLPYMSSGVPLNGARMRRNYAVVFYPRGNLSCAAATTTAVTCPLAATPYSNASGANNVSSYACAAGTWDGNEKVFRLDLPSLTDLSFTLTNADGKNRALFLLSSCSELSGCRAGGTTQITRKLVAAGTYYLVVDGATAADNGPFTLEGECSAASTVIACNTTLPAELTSGTGQLTNWTCASAQSGPEKIYEITVGATTPKLTATLANKSAADLNVLISRGNAFFNPAAPTCLTASPDRAVRFDATPGTYYVTVDGFAGASGSYDLTVECSEPELSCPSPVSFIDITSTVPVLGDTSGKVNRVDEYSCVNSAYGPAGTTRGYSGPEDVYRFTVTATSVVSFLFSGSPDQHLLILGSCYEGTCIHEGGCSETIAPGDYLLVVDGVNGAEGPYAITPLVVPATPYKTWSQCPECQSARCTGTPADVRKKNWSFDSANYCGTGCDFSMFAVVECGTEFHIPYDDVETFHFQIYDVLQQRYLDLTAVNDSTTCPINQTGPLVQWDDETCTAIPCPAGGCGGGGDCHTDRRTIDVSFRGANNEPICGVYRLDFLNWGGHLWDIYANCSGKSEEGYYIYRDLCSALANYRPLPEVGIAEVTVDNAQCGARTVSGTITVENIGCLPAAGYEVTITQAAPNPPDPKTYTVSLLKGQREVVAYSYDFTMPPPAQLVFQVDPAARILECSENSGSVVSCGSNQALQRTVSQDACPPDCSSSLDAGQGGTICQGAEFRLDGSGSSLSCSFLGSPEYRWEDAAGNPVAGCDWGPGSAVCVVPAAAMVPGVNLFTMRLRCWDGTTAFCERSGVVQVEVIDNVTPPTLGNTLLAMRRVDDVELNWTVLGGAPISGYRLFKDADARLCSGIGSPHPSCPALTRATLADVPVAQIQITDTAAVSGSPQPIAHYQIVGLSCLGDLEGPY